MHMLGITVALPNITKTAKVPDICTVDSVAVQVDTLILIASNLALQLTK